MIEKAEKAALESSHQLLKTGVRYLAAVTRKGPRASRGRSRCVNGEPRRL
jgi:hypothetical protein